jgi:T-complex protein 1 subunit gamma
MKALQTALDTCNRISRTIDINNYNEMKEIVTAAIGTKFSSRWGEQMVDIAIKSVKKVVQKRGDYTEVDIKRFVRIEKIPGGDLSECRVLDGVMFNKDVTHAKMRRRIENPRILLLDCPLEYKKGESQTNVEIMNEDDFNALLRQEEEYIEQICANVVAFKPDIVITEKGVSDLAQHYLLKAGITAFRRIRKTDQNRVARAVGATVVNRTDEIQESDIGTGCGLFEVRKIGDE